MTFEEWFAARGNRWPDEDRAGGREAEGGGPENRSATAPGVRFPPCPPPEPPKGCPCCAPKVAWQESCSATIGGRAIPILVGGGSYVRKLIRRFLDDQPPVTSGARITIHVDPALPAGVVLFVQPRRNDIVVTILANVGRPFRDPQRESGLGMVW